MSRICNQCGHDVGQEDLYCINCGIFLEKNVNGSGKGQQKTPSKDGSNAPLSLGDYMFIGLILMIPIVNLIVLFIWAFDKYGNLNRKNLAKAGLIYLGIFTVMTIVFSIGLVRAVMLDERIFPQEEYYEYHIEHPDMDEWMQLPYGTDET
ncbi:hypothetical protein [Anaerotignum sp. MB30-C6]|uniref:hypothetical protein n=1 Tax=Anaerotignum sp. MB30-C6 TaxID=3070814 RepID=UPI0027DD6F5F|nr:hypothetical protein [Anaerotignum sp. MB30-C6]WMI81624.1 hypothetical protein RBQ60_02480 [Anaerotignum sp. MB30-C6]